LHPVLVLGPLELAAPGARFPRVAGKGDPYRGRESALLGKRVGSVVLSRHVATLERAPAVSRVGSNGSRRRVGEVLARRGNRRDLVTRSTTPDTGWILSRPRWRSSSPPSSRERRPTRYRSSEPMTCWPGRSAPATGSRPGFSPGPPGLLDRCDGWVAHVDGTPPLGCCSSAMSGTPACSWSPPPRSSASEELPVTRLRTALLDARERGRTSSTPQSSALGRSVYAALAPRSSAPTSYGSTGLASTRTLELYRPPTRRQWRRSRDRCQACRGTTGLSHYPSPYALICFAVST
jgi:hypothetical protein